MGVRSAYLTQEIIPDTSSFPATFHGKSDYSLLPRRISKGCKSPSSCWKELEDAAYEPSLPSPSKDNFYKQQYQNSMDSTIRSFDTSDSGFNEEHSISIDELEKQFFPLPLSTAQFAETSRKKSVVDSTSIDNYTKSNETSRRNSISSSFRDAFDVEDISDFKNSFVPPVKFAHLMDANEEELKFWEETLFSENSTMNDSFDEYEEDRQPSINLKCSEKKRLRPSLEYYTAPIFPYCRKDHLNEEEKETANAIRNVVARQYGPKMRKTINNFNKSLHRIRNTSLGNRKTEENR
ncbi:uncharacterized protein LOC123308723 [Coccinella septempunctata]|uniref:uncharacterized protein LOC123308723 n=1 Tax=Coccinella septempunctata TaxID=41139 RepID=UPI001D09475B|nr:uncharacterized protein LOC123308723 [Coccinella septempunctata]